MKSITRAAGGGVLVSKAGGLSYFDSKGNGLEIPWTVPVSNPEDVGLPHNDLVERTPMELLELRELEFAWQGIYLAVRDGRPFGRGRRLGLSAQ